MGMKIGIAVAALAVLGGVGFFMMKGGCAAKTAPATAATASRQRGGPAHRSAARVGPPIGEPRPPSNKGKQISLYRPTMAISDYRIEIQGQIEKKALGWIFRAHDPKNYYVMKLEWLKPGVDDPIPALIKYAVIDGKESTHTQVMLPLDNVTLTTHVQDPDRCQGQQVHDVRQRQARSITGPTTRSKLGGAGLMPSRTSAPSSSRPILPD